MKVLFIVYYWPPSGGSGVQRPLKFVKYMVKAGLEVTVFCPENPSYTEIDLSLINEVSPKVKILKLPIKEPYGFYKKFTGNKDAKSNPVFFGKKRKGIFGKIAHWIRSNVFIPDARMLWIKPATTFLKDYLRKNKIDVIISTGPPHSLHLIALNLKTHFPEIKWIADFRDPWTLIDYFSDLNLTNYALKKHKKLELKVLQSADEVVAATPQMGREFEKISKREIKIITNGFDEDDFEEVKDLAPELNKFLIRHIGMIGKTRNHEIFWKALRELVIENQNFKSDLKIEFYGVVDEVIKQSIEEYGLTPFVEYFSYVTHREAIVLQKTATVLYLPINRTINAMGFLTGKLFEYLAVNRPILCIAPIGGDCDKVLKETNAGLVSDFEDLITLKNNILFLYKNRMLKPKINDKDVINNYSRKKLTSNLILLFK